MSWQKISDKRYTLRINDEPTDILTPYGKVERIFQAFVGTGGVISAEGVVQNDIISLISNFSNVGNILLSTYGPRGEIVVEGDCSQLSTVEVISLFEIGTDVLEGFIATITEMKKAPEVVDEKGPQKTKKTKV